MTAAPGMMDEDNEAEGQHAGTSAEPKMNDAQTALMIQRIMTILDDVDVISRQDFTLQMLAGMIGRTLRMSRGL